MSDPMENLLQALLAGSVHVGVEYSRATLVASLVANGMKSDVAEAVALLVRDVAKRGGDLGDFSISPIGERRGRRYLFGRVEESTSDAIESRTMSSGTRARKFARIDGPPIRSMGPSGVSDHALTIYHGDNLDILNSLPDACVDLIYIDPPFNTGKVQRLDRVRTVRDNDGDRVGFQGMKYRTEKTGSMEYVDSYEDFTAFIRPRLVEARRLLKPTGSLFVHLDYREVHYCKVLLDSLFGRDAFINELIWAYDYGARSKSRWSAKHDNILWYVMNPASYTFNFEEMDRIPYMAPGLVGPEKAARGKTPTDVWWHTIVPTNGAERTGYPTQKPLGVLTRIVKVHSSPGDVVLDFFAGSGTTGEAAVSLGRSSILVDCNEEAIDVMMKRLARYSPVLHRSCGTMEEAPRDPEEGVSDLDARGFSSDEGD